MWYGVNADDGNPLIRYGNWLTFERTGKLQQLRKQFQKKEAEEQQQLKSNELMQTFNINDQVLLERTELKGRKVKLEPRWKSPYKVGTIIGENVYELEDRDGKRLKAPVNGRRLKRFFV